MGVGGGAVRAEVEGAVLYEAAGEEDSGEVLVADADPGVGLAVFQEDVVAGLELFDEVVFQQEGVFFGGNDGVHQVGDLADHGAGLAVQRLRRAEVLRHAALEVLRLADIDHRPFLVQKAVDPGGMGQIFDFFTDFHCHKFRNFCSEWGVPANSETISPTYGEIN